MELIWLSSISLFMGNIKFIYTTSKVRNGLEALCGAVMLIFGVILLLE